MKLTLASLSQAVHEELGRDPSRSSMEALVNEAGEAWVNAWNWTYLRDRSQDIQTEAGVESYKLGLGVRNLSAIHRPTTAWPPVELVDFDHYESMRSSFFGEQLRSFTPIATLQYGQQADDDRPRLYLLIFPATLAERLVVVFQAGWVPLDEADDVADIPGPLAQPFLQWVRLYANSREFPERYPMGVLDAYKASPAFREAARVDGALHKTIIPRLTGAGAIYARKRAGRAGFYTRSDYLRSDGGNLF